MMNASYDNARFQLHPQKKFTNEFVVRFFGDARNDQAVVDVMEEFRRNGRDVDLPEEATMLKCVKEPQASRTQSFSRMCVFCKANGETPVFYGGHSLKDELGRVVCPVLVRYVCPLCGATGDRAHTVKYCPFKPVQGHYNAGTKTWERNAIGKVVPAKKFLPISK